MKRHSVEYNLLNNILYSGYWLKEQNGQAPVQSQQINAKAKSDFSAFSCWL